jgi:1,4-dihydroxy-2-naphthoyl-CoA hydrolase
VPDDGLTQLLQSVMPLCATLDIRAESQSPEKVVLSMDWEPELCTGGDLLHGGAVMALADSAGGACAFANLPEGATGTATIESKTNFLGGVRSGSVTATATPLHRGSMTIVIETEVRDSDGTLVAKVTQTQAVLGK